MGTANTPLIVASLAFLTTAIGWLIRELWLRREHKRQAAPEAGTILKERKAHLEDMIAKTEDVNSKQTLIAKLDEVNAALIGFYSKRLRHTLEEAGLPPEEMLIADGRRILQPEEASQLDPVIAEVDALRPFLSTRDLFVLGNAYYHTGEYQDAKNIYDQIINLIPDDPDVLNNRGIIYRQLERYEEALTDLNRSLQIRPSHPSVLVNRGNTYNQLGRHKEALSDLNHSLELRPDDPLTLSNRSIAYFYLERYEEALVDCNRSLELRPDDPDTLGNRGITYGHLERYGEASTDLNRSLEIRPHHPDTLYNLACLFALWGKADDSVAYLEKAIALNKKNREDAKKDKDFDNIRDDPRFKELIELED